MRDATVHKKAGLGAFLNDYIWLHCTILPHNTLRPLVHTTTEQPGVHKNPAQRVGQLDSIVEKSEY